MTDCTDMPEDERMTPIELKAVREWLGVTAEWLADHLGVALRTVRRWESGARDENGKLKYPIPDGVRLEVEHLEALTGRVVTMNIDTLRDAREPAVVTYRSDEEYWAAEPQDGLRWPASWHRGVVMRVAEEVPGLVIVEPADVRHESGVKA